jgi:hypothetical protein
VTEFVGHIFTKISVIGVIAVSLFSSDVPKTTEARVAQREYNKKLLDSVVIVTNNNTLILEKKGDSIVELNRKILAKFP